MGTEKYLIDTNVAIEYFGETLPNNALTFIDKIIDGSFYFSIINKIELLCFPNITDIERQNFLEFITAAHVLELDDEIVNSTIDIRRANKIKLPDAIIAASALVNELILVTRNTKDFDKIQGMKIINPHDL